MGGIMAFVAPVLCPEAFVSKKQKKHHQHGAGNLRDRIDRAAEDGRFQHALELTRELYKQEPTPEHRKLLHTIGLGRARQLRSEGRTRDAAATLQGLLHTPGITPEWKAEIAQELAGAGEVQQAVNLLGSSADPETIERMHAAAADLAIRREGQGRALLPPSLHADFDRIRNAFMQLEAGQDDAVRDTLQAIGLRSPFLEWKLFLRGLQAYYQNDDARALENWQRLKPDRFPARLAAPYRYTIDRDYQAAQSPETQNALRKQMGLFQTGEGERLLGELRQMLGRGQNLAPVFRKVEQVKPVLQREAPHLVPRLATVFYWATLVQGQPEDVPRLQRVFGSPPDDPSFHRLNALAWERAGVLTEAHKHWQKYAEEIALRPQYWPGEQAIRARALIWQRMGRNASTIPDGAALKRLPKILRDDPDRPKPLRPGAEECYRKSIELAPDQAETYLLLFRHLREQEKPAKAIEVGRELLARQTDHFEMLLELGGLLLHEQHYGEAVEAFERARKNNPLDRGLRARVAASHTHHARTLAEQGRYDEARREYQTSLELDSAHPAAVLCKWAACELKAGDAAKGEELLQRALGDVGSGLSIAYSMVIEAIRLKLPPGVKKRFDQEFKVGLAGPVDPQAAVLLADTTAAHEAAGVDYRGKKSHQKKVLDYLKKAKTAPFTEQQLEQLCEALRILGSYRLSIDYIYRGREEHDRNPVFPLIHAEIEMGRAEGVFPVYYVQPWLAYALQLAQQLPPGPRREQLLDRIQGHLKFLEATNPFRRGFNDIFDPFGYEDDEDDEEYEDEDEW